MGFYDKRPNVLQVTRDEMESIAGLPWEQAIAGREADIRNIVHGYNTRETERVGWVPPTDDKGNQVLYLPLNHAWLREIDGRAFLYAQNW